MLMKNKFFPASARNIVNMYVVAKLNFEGSTRVLI